MFKNTVWKLKELKMKFCLIQSKYNCIFLGLSQAKLNQFGCTVCTLYKQTVWNQFSCNVYTHSTAKLLPLWCENSFSSQAGRSPRTWERTVNPLTFNGVERALEPSVPSIPLRREFPCLVWHMEGTLSRVGPRFQARAAWKLDTDWLARMTYITI